MISTTNKRDGATEDLVAVILAAGLGTRLLPVTKAMPKEMLPLVDRPILHYILEEVVDSGLDRAVIVTARGKDAIHSYFDRVPELDRVLESRGELDRLSSVQRIIDACHITYVRQHEQLGIAHAVLAAQHAIGPHAFVLYFPDDVITAEVPATRQLLDVYHRYNASVLAVEPVRKEDTRLYGIVDAEPLGGGVFKVKGLVEKPLPEDAPSNLGIVGRYVLTPSIFPAIEETSPGANGELQITDSLRLLLEEEPIYAYAFTGHRYDTGNPVGYLRATVALALQRPDLAAEVRQCLMELLGSPSAPHV